MKNPSRPKAMRVFISHASQDEKLARAVIKLLHAGAGIDPDQDIFCTSAEGFGVAPGKDFSEEIRRRLKQVKIVFLLFSENFLRSDYCKYEQGAAYMMSLATIPLLVPPVTAKDLGLPFSKLHAGRIDDSKAWNHVLEILQKTIGAKPAFSQWEPQRNACLTQIRGILTRARRRPTGESQGFSTAAAGSSNRQLESTAELDPLGDLAAQHCVATTEMMPRVTAMHVEEVREQIGDWSLATGGSWDKGASEVLRRDFYIATYSQLCNFAFKIAKLAEEEGHHPSILLDWGRLRIESWTHKTWHVSKNDLILAAKINRILQGLPPNLRVASGRLTDRADEAPRRHASGIPALKRQTG